jgi:hypothetical protein
MKFYKLIQNLNKTIDAVLRNDGSCIPIDYKNNDYQQFLKDVAEQGIEIVEGPDIYEPDYATLRQQEYPPYSEQFDQIFHGGLDAWKETIQEIKDKYPKTITGGVIVGPVPEWVQEAVDEWILLQTPQEEVVEEIQEELPEVVEEELNT